MPGFKGHSVTLARVQRSSVFLLQKEVFPRPNTPTPTPTHLDAGILTENLEKPQNINGDLFLNTHKQNFLHHYFIFISMTVFDDFCLLLQSLSLFLSTAASCTHTKTHTHIYTQKHTHTHKSTAEHNLQVLSPSTH